MLTALREIAARLRAFFVSRELDRDFDEELESHVAMQIEDNVRRGMSPDQARRSALLRVGGPASLRQQHREARGFPALDAVLQDVRFAFRLIAKERWFSAAAAVALALGIGVNVVGFTMVNAAFLRGLPVEDSSRVYLLSWQTRSGSRANVSNAELQDWRAQVRAVDGLAAYVNAQMNISDDRAFPEEVRGAFVTSNTFDVLRQQPFGGRAFTTDDDAKGAERVAIIGYNVWKNRYGSDPNVTGRSLRVNGQPATIIGVMPEAMKFPDNTAIWVPFVPTDAQERRDSRILTVFGRLRPDTDRRTAQTELHGVAQRFAAAYPDTNRDIVGGRVETFTERFVGGPARMMFLATMGAVSLVLLIACANVANLLLSRSAHRAREIALRMALGATRWRVVRQLLIESVVLGFAGGGIGLLLAIAGVRIVDAAIQDPGKPYWIVFELDYIVFGYVAAICVLTAILFGLTPALRISKTGCNDVLKEGGRGSVGDRRARRLGAGIVIAELALSVVLLAGAGLMFRSFMKLYTLDLGFQTDGLVTLRMQLPLAKYPNAESRQAFFQKVESRVAAVPGVQSVALTTGVPPLNGGERVVEIEGRGQSGGDHLPDVSIVTISPRFFDVLNVPLVRGQAFRDVDDAAGSDVVIVNERLASRFFPGEEAIGKRLRWPQPQPEPGQLAPPWRTIVGIAPSIRQGSAETAYLDPVVYIPYRRESPTIVSLMVRASLPPATVMDAVRREVLALDRDQPVFSIRTMEQVLAESRWPHRVFGSLFVTFAVIALVLSAVGLYAVMAYSVAQRTQEIGVRMALGAQRRQVSWLILRRGLAQLAIGLVIGLAGALTLSRVLQRVLVEITPADPTTFAGVTIILSVVSIAACMLPALRATRIDPLVALREE
jgi:putative ABC transport system permease protein